MFVGAKVSYLRVLLVAGFIAILSFNFMPERVAAQSGSSLTTIDVSGAGTAALQGTAATAIDALGDVAGIYRDANGDAHAFVRTANGAITPFDGVVLAQGTSYNGNGTYPIGFDSAGNLVGIYVDNNAVVHGFIRSAAGVITSFDAPGVGTSKTQGTYPISINAKGDVAGMFFDTFGLTHGFVRTAANGNITTFDVITPSPQAVVASGIYFVTINSSDEIAGTYLDGNGAAHGFVRTSSGTVSAVDAPNAGTSPYQGTAVTGIDAAGDIAGTYGDSANIVHSFVRSASGNFTVIDAPGAGTAYYQGTYLLSFDTVGDAAGAYTDSNDNVHGWFLAANGTIEAYDVPAAIAPVTIGTMDTAIRSRNLTRRRASAQAASRRPMTLVRRIAGALNKVGSDVLSSPQLVGGSNGPYVTLGMAMNASGEIAGIYRGEDLTAHGFVRTPSGVVTEFSAPNAGTGAQQGTGPLAIDASGTIAGTFADINSELHGFLFTPAFSTTTVTISSDVGSSIYGGPVTLTASVAASSGSVPNGETIVFLSGTTEVGSATLSNQTTSLITTDLPAGTDSVTALYGGDLNFAGGRSSAITQIVSKATSTTTLQIAPNPSSFEQPVTMTASVSGQLGGVPSGTMTFQMGTKALGTAPVNGSAVLITTQLPQGSESITASYSGDANFSGSTSSSVSQTVNGEVIQDWTWMGGSSSFNAYGTYGILGVAADGNIPGARYGSFTWTDANGNFWLFGGIGFGSSGPDYGNDLNDLWEMNPATGQWAWMGGSSTNATLVGQHLEGLYGTLGTPAPGNIPGPRDGGATWTDASGNLWLFGGNGVDSTGSYGLLNDLWMYRPTSQEWAWMGGSNVGGQSSVFGTLGTPASTNIPGGRVNAVSWTDSNGNFWLFGGGGLNDLWKYNPVAGQWTWIAGSNQLAAFSAGQPGVYGKKGTAAAGNTPGSRSAAEGWTDSSGNLWLFGGYGVDAGGSTGYLNDLWMFNTTNELWEWVGGSNTAAGNTAQYGSQGTGVAGNTPGGRLNGNTWVDTAGNAWIFGGFGIDSKGNYGDLNDLWKFNPSTGVWTWVSGSDIVGTIGVYGTVGNPAAGNVPGARSEAASWVDTSGNLWLFGGNGSCTVNLCGEENDLWRYQPYATVATPVFSVAGGNYATSQSVQITDATASATIYYTTNGVIPSASSAKYTGTITVSSTETIKAVAILSGDSTSPVATATYNIGTATATPTFSVPAGTYTAIQQVTISDTASGATIYYTTDNTVPTLSSTIYTGAITVSSPETIQAIALASGQAPSVVAAAKYTINLPAAATPGFSPGAGGYTSAQSVTISDSTPNATIYYTTNESTPTTASPVYSGPINVSGPETIQAIAVASGYSTSAVGIANYTFPPAATPTFSPVQGAYPSAQTVTISDTTPGAKIYYSTYGTPSVAYSTLYTGPITVSYTETIEAIAVASGFSSSPVASALYTIPFTPTVEVIPSASNITTAQALTVTVYVYGDYATPTGSVVLTSGSYKSATTVLSGGSAIFNIPAGSLAIPAGALAIGTDTLTVVYTPDASSSSAYTSAAGTASVTVTPAQAIYTAVKLGTLGGASSIACGINNSGEVVGGSQTSSGVSHAFLYSGTMTDLGTLSEGSASWALSINDAGQVVGTSGANFAGTAGPEPSCEFGPEPSPPPSVAFLYSNGVMTAPLSAVPGISGSYAFGINNSGQIVGYEYNYSIPGTSPDFPFLDNDGNVIDLGALPGAVASSPSGYAYSWATGINNSGQVAGISEGVNYSHAFLYTSGSMVDLGTLPGGAGSEAFAINNTGQVTGFSYTSGNGYTHAFLSSGGAMADLGTLPGNLTSAGLGINDAGQVVGEGDSHAFIYSGGAMVDLNYFVSLPAGVYLTYASAINNRGQIAANGSDGNAYLLTTPLLIPNVTVSLSSSDITTAQPLSVTVAVSGGSGNPTPTGTVTLTSGGYISSATTLTGGSATINVSAGSLATGSDTLTAIYTPDAASSSTYNSASGSNSVVVASGTPPAPTPTFSPAGGTYTSAQTVTISDAASGATIYYTVNGTTPTTTSTMYTGPITVSSSETIEAIAAASGFTTSDVATAAYTIPGFTLSASPASVSVAQGSSATISITVTDLEGFAGSVTLSASGLPSNVIASIAPNSPTGTQGLILSVASSATVTSSPVTVTITGTSGTLSASTTVALTITAQTGLIFDNIVNSCSPYTQTEPSCGYYPVFGPTGDFAVPSSDYAAAQFTSSAGGIATDARITVVQDATGPGLGASGLLNVAIFSDANGLPGTQISETATGVLAPYCCNSAILTAWFNQSVSLDAGVPYWLVVTPGASDTYVAWSVGGLSPVPAAQTLSSGETPQECDTWCAYGPSNLQFAIDSGTVPPPGFVLSASPTTLNIPQGGSTTSTITVTDEGGFSGAVALTSSGLPSGVTASFAAGSVAGTQVLTLSASSSAAVTSSPATVTIAGTSGSSNTITAVAVTVTAASSFTLSPSAANLSVVQGSSNTDTITVTGASGFTGAVTLAATGLPNGVTASFASNPTTGSSVLTLTANSTATVGGPVTMTITGTSGSLTASTTIALTVTPPTGFALSPSAAILSMTQGSSNTDTITVTPANGFTGSVTLAVTGLPGGVTASFSPNPTTTGSSVLTLTVSSAATVGGPVTVTITGTSGSLTASTTIALTVTAAQAKTTPTVTVTPPSASITTAQPLTLTVAVSGGTGNPTPTGTITFAIGSYTSAATTLNAGSASINIPSGSLSAGTDILTATYSGDTNYVSTSGTASIVVTNAGSFSLSDNFNPPSAQWSNTSGNWTAAGGDYFAAIPNDSPFAMTTLPLDVTSYTLNVTVNSLGDSGIIVRNNASGWIVLILGGEGYGQGFRACNPCSSGETNHPNAGNSIYWADSSNPSGTSNLITGVFIPGNTYTITVTAVGETFSAYINGSPTPVTTFTDSIAGPAGGVGLYDDQPNVTTANGFGPPTTYSNFNLTGTELPSPTVTVTPSVTSITTAQALTVAVSVSGGTGNPTPTGSVTLSGGGYTSAATTLSGGSATISIGAGDLSVGSDTLTASYVPDSAGSATYNSASGTTPVSVTSGGKAAPTLTVTASPASITFQQSANVTVSVAGGAGQATPTGIVTLASGNYSSEQTLAAGEASFSIAAGTLSSGVDTLTASYSGDGVYSSGTGTTTITVSPVVVMIPALSSVSPGASSTATVTLTAGNSYSGTMNLICTLTSSPTGAQSLPTCSLNPASVALASGASGTTVLTVNTTAASSAALERPSRGNLWGLGGGAVLAIVLMFGVPTRRRRWLAMLVLFGVTAVAGIIGCGGSGSTGGGGGGGSSTQATTAGTYTFTVAGTDSANAKITASTTVSVTVQ